MNFKIFSKKFLLINFLSNYGRKCESSYRIEIFSCLYVGLCSLMSLRNRKFITSCLNKTEAKALSIEFNISVVDCGENFILKFMNWTSIPKTLAMRSALNLM